MRLKEQEIFKIVTSKYHYVITLVAVLSLPPVSNMLQLCFLSHNSL